MLFADEKKIPRELFLTKIQRFFTTKALLNLSSVCKNWKNLIESQEIWRQRLSDLGIDNIPCYQQYFKINNLKTLYLALTGEIEFPELSLSESYSQTEDWQVLPLNDRLVDLFRQGLQLVIADENNINRDSEFCEAVSDLNSVFYDSIVDYVNNKTQTGTEESLERQKKLLLGDSDNRTINAFYEKFCNDDCLFRQLKLFNVRDFIFHSFYYCFASLFGLSRSLHAATSYTQTQIIKYNHSIVVIHETFFKVESNKADDVIVANSHSSQFNLKEKIIIQISASGWKLIGVHIGVKQSAVELVRSLFEHPCAKAFLLHQYAITRRRPNPELHEFIRTRATGILEYYLQLRCLLTHTCVDGRTIDVCLDHFFYYYQQQFLVNPKNEFRNEIMNFILDVCESFKPNLEFVLKRWIALNAVAKREKKTTILQKTLILLIHMLQDNETCLMLSLKPAKIENLRSKFILDLDKIATRQVCCEFNR